MPEWNINGIKKEYDENQQLNNEKRHQELCDLIHDTYIRKNSDYGNAFGMSVEKYGITAAMVRMEDKWNRLNSLALKGQAMVKDESITDTLLDLANYCLMTVMELEK